MRTYDTGQPVAVEGTPAAGTRAARWRQYAVLLPLLVLLILWVWVFYAEGAFRGGPSGKAFGADFAMFVAAARLMHDGRNPYDHALLYRTESRLMAQQGLPMTPKRQVVRVGNPPLFFWALEPLSGRPFQAVAWGWMLGLYLASLAGFLAALAALGWERRLVPALIFLLMPETFLGVFYGNVIGLVFFAVGVALLLARRYPAVAGALLVLAWLKPPVALPIVLLMALFLTPRPVRLLGAFSLASAVLLGLTLVTTGWHSLVLWIHGLFAYSRDMAIQPDVASLAGLYSQWAPSALRIAFSALLLALALGLTVFAWKRQAAPTLLATAWLWFVWLLATPYAHFFDLMLLAIPLLALVGRNGARITDWVPATALYLMYVDLFLIQPAASVYLLPLPLVAIAIMAYRVRAREGASA